MPALVTDDLQQELMVESNDCPVLNLTSTDGEDTVFYQISISEEAWLKLLDTIPAKWCAEYTKAGTTFVSIQSVTDISTASLNVDDPYPTNSRVLSVHTLATGITMRLVTDMRTVSLID